MSSQYQYYYRSEWVDDAEELIAINLTRSNVDISTNISTVDMETANITAHNTYSSNIYSSNIANTGEIETSVLTASNIGAWDIVGNYVDGLTVNAASNLNWGGHSLYHPYPQDQSDWDDLIPFKGDYEGMIDVSWLRKPLTAKDILTDLWGLAEAGIDAIELLNDLYNFLQGQGNQALLNAIQQALETAGEEGSSNQILVSWKNLKGRPLGNVGNTIGMKGDLVIGEDKSIKSIPSANYTTDAYGNVVMTLENADTILNVGTKELFINNLSIGNESYISHSNQDFKLHSWLFSSNVISNSNSPLSSIMFSASNNWIVTSGSVEIQDRLQVDNLVACDEYMSFSNGQMLFNSSNLRTKYTKYDSNYQQNSMNSYVAQYADKWSFSTQDSQSNYGGIAPIVLQSSIDSNGSLFIRKDIKMNSPLVLRSYSNDFYGDYTEGRLSMETQALRFYQYTDYGNSNTTNNWFSMNSNGMFLQSTAYPKIMGKMEAINVPNPVDPLSNITLCNFSRLQFSYSNGLTFGTGLSKNELNNDYDFFNVSRLGEVSTYANDTGVLNTVVNLNSELCNGGTRIKKDGSVYLNGDVLDMNSNVVITASGSIKRNNFLVSPNGYITASNLQIGALTVTQDGSIYCNGKLILNSTTGKIVSGALDLGDTDTLMPSATPTPIPDGTYGTQDPFQL